MCKSRMKLAILQGMCLYKLNKTDCQFAVFLLLLFYLFVFLIIFFFCFINNLLGFLYY